METIVQLLLAIKVRLVENPYDSCSEKDGSTEEARGLGGIFQTFNASFCFLT